MLADLFRRHLFRSAGWQSCGILLILQGCTGLEFPAVIFNDIDNGTH